VKNNNFGYRTWKFFVQGSLNVAYIALRVHLLFNGALQ